MLGFGFGTRRRGTIRGAPSSAPPLLPFSTPILFEGDSNTDWGYQATGWAKQALRLADGRYYLPVAGDFALAGSTVRSMVARQGQVVAKVRAMVALAGHCIVWFQIGTNGGTLSADLPALSTWVAALRAAGATVCANTCPTFGQPIDPAGYVGGINTWITTVGNVDDVVDVNAIVTTGATSQTHYEPAQNRAVGQAVAARLLAKISAANIYADPVVGLVVDDFTGASGTLGSNVTGRLPTGWNLSGLPAGSAAVAIVEANASLSGRRAVRITVTGPTVASGDPYAYLGLTKSVVVSLAQGDVLDGWASVSLVSTTDTQYQAYLDIGGGRFPADLGGSVEDAGAWGDDTHVWRAYPVNQPQASSTTNAEFRMLVRPGQTATFELAGFAHVVREHSAAVAPVNTAAPVVAAAQVGGSPGIAAAGTYTGTQPITLGYVYYLDQLPLAAGYVLASSDAGKTLTAHETATNAGGSTGAVSVGVVVGAAAPVVTATTLDASVHPDGGQVAYSNGNRTATNTYANYVFVPSTSAKTAGRYYYEAVNDSALFGVGAGESSFGDARCVYLLPNGVVFANGGFNAGVSALVYAVGDRVGIDLDSGARTVRFRVGGGAWTSAYPIGGTGGIFARLALNNAVGSRGTMRFAAGDWVDAPPAGAGVWAA